MSEVKNMMLEDSKDFLDNVEITTIASECKKLKVLEDEIVEQENKLKELKNQADYISSEVIPDLLNQGLGDIIKNNVFVTFGKGEDNKAKQLLDLAAENGYQPQQKSNVAWNTLTALYGRACQGRP
jgi:hypothetical protein